MRSEWIGGKTWSLVLEPLRHINNPQFGSVFFRRTYPELTNVGGVWDEMRRWYPYFGGKPNRSDLLHTFPSGARVECSHLQYEESIDSWAGSQIALINFDQLEHFTKRQFFFMLSRNRSASGIRGYVRATCNPDPDSFVADFISWWIDQETGYPIPERAGKIRYFVHIADTLHWSDSKEELINAFPHIHSESDPPKSVTFVPALIDDNPIGLAMNPGYKSSLLALPLVDQERLLKGNWKIKPAAGKVFNKEWFQVIPDLPPACSYAVRFFDTAGTEKKIGKSGHDPDYTAGVLLVKAGDSWIIADCIAQQIGPAAVETLMLETAKTDATWAKNRNIGYHFAWELEPGSAAERDAVRIIRALAGIFANPVRPSGDKLVRSRALAGQCQPPPGTTYGNVKVLRGAWNSIWLNHMHNIPDGAHDDIMDASAGAFNECVQYAPKQAAQGTAVGRLYR